jgi:agmatinase
MDVVEVAPAFDISEITALAAATMVWEYLALRGAMRKPHDDQLNQHSC